MVVTLSAARAQGAARGEGNRIRLTACCDIFLDSRCVHAASERSVRWHWLSLRRSRVAVGGLSSQQPPGQIRPAPGRGARARVSAAEHPRVQAALDARRPAAPGAAREVSGHRHPRPPAGADSDRTSSNTVGDGDGPAQPAGDGQRQRHVGRAARSRASQAISASRYKDRIVMFTNARFPRASGRGPARRSRRSSKPTSRPARSALARS